MYDGKISLPVGTVTWVGWYTASQQPSYDTTHPTHSICSAMYPMQERQNVQTKHLSPAWSFYALTSTTSTASILLGFQ